MLARIFDRSEVKESIILLVYGSLLIETLNTVTLVTMILGIVLVWLSIRPSKLVRNIASLIVFGSYWFIYGKVIDPEVGLNFLTTIIVLKILEKETERDRYMIFFGIMLLISAGTLFEKSAIYIFFFLSSFFILIQDFYGNHKLPFNLTDVSKLMLWVLPIAVLLFFFAPRMLNPLPMSSPKPNMGEIGYTPDVSISQIESLNPNNSAVFEVQLDRRIPSDQLYWRGNVLSFSDGWNWPSMPSDKPSARILSEDSFQSELGGINQKFRLLSKQDFIFTMDHPISIKGKGGYLQLENSKSVYVSSRTWMPRYEAISSNTSNFIVSGPLAKSFSRNPLNKAETKWVNETFISSDFPSLQKEIQSYFSKQEFSYSLSPGRVETFLSFMQDKKTGFCAHYASALALILRAKGIPSRLVSGFMGGSYNQYADFYKINQNDAHVWVEANYEDRWIRLDPTVWIAPNRVQMSGEDFISQLNKSSSKYSFKLAWVADAQKWFAQWDFLLYQKLESMDYYGQEAFFQKINFNREWLFSLIPLLLASFIGIYAYTLSRTKQKVTEVGTLWRLLKKKLGHHGIEFSYSSLQETHAKVRSSNHPESERMLSLLKEMELFTYNELGSYKEIKEKIKKF